MRNAGRKSQELPRGTLRRSDCCGTCVYANQLDDDTLRCWAEPPILPDAERGPVVDYDWPACRSYVRRTDD